MNVTAWPTAALVAPAVSDVVNETDLTFMFTALELDPASAPDAKTWPNT